MDADGILTVATQQELEEVLCLPRVLLYKHSTRCGASMRALREVERFVRAGAPVPVYAIDVVRHRDISRRAAELLGVRHESPQAILVERGASVWHVSHYHLTAAALREAAGTRAD